MADMTKEQAIKHLEVIKGDCALVGDIHALDMAISALSADGEYIKKEDALKRPYALWNGSEYVYVVNEDYLNGLTTYSFPDSAENKGDLISRQAVIDELNKWDWQELYLPIHFKENIIDVLPNVQPVIPNITITMSESYMRGEAE